jgi:transcriptional regulator with XRE-family HTH domain
VFLATKFATLKTEFDIFTFKLDTKEKTNMPFVEKLKKIKENKHLTNAEISTLANLPLTTITRVFSGATPNPTFETIVAISTAMGISLDELTGLKEPDEKPIASRIETTLTSYSELLEEKNVRLKEKDAQIAKLTEEKETERKEKTKLLVFLLSFIAVVFLVLLFDIFNGHFGYFRY